MKLIPKYLNPAGPIKKTNNWFSNMMIGAAMAESPGVMTASGWRQNKDGDYVQDKQDDPSVEKLRSNLSDISFFSPTNPVTAAIEHGPKMLLWGLGKSGNTWARAKLISKEMVPTKSEISLEWRHPQASQFVGNNINGEPLYMPDLETFSKGKEMATKFFNHPVVKLSNKHNLELAKRLGINIPDRNPADVVSKPVKVSLSGADKNTYADTVQSYYGDPDALVRFNWMPMTRNLLHQASIHENLHRGFYSAAPRMHSMSVDYYNNQYIPESMFYKWKTLKLLKPEYYDSYLGDYEGGEAGPNLIDLGRELGLKLGLKYPGYEAAKNMLNKYNGYKKFIIPQLNDTKAGMRHVWDAMTGKYFAIPAVAGVSTLNNSNDE